MFKTLKCFNSCNKMCLFILLFVVVLELYLYGIIEVKVGLTKTHKSKAAHVNVTLLHKKYLVYSPRCKIPDLNPFDISLSQFVRREDRVDCSERPPLTQVVFNSTTKEHRLRVDPAAVPFYLNNSAVSCCVAEIQQQTNFGSRRGCECFNDNWLLDSNHQLLLVHCYNNESSLIYKNLHATVMKMKTKQEEEGKPKPGQNKLNVLLIGFDSMSRLNLYRTMPQTVTHLNTQGWTEMRGYNKIGDNTLPNLMAILTGLPPEVLNTAHVNYFDSYPYIWKNFSSAGYATAYAEDEPEIDTFNCHLRGFTHLPTDYYPRSFFLVGEREFKQLEKGRKCLGFKSSSEHLFGYLLDYVQVYKIDKFFGLFWENDFSHNNMNMPSSEDTQVLKLLQQLKSSGTLNTTMVIFLSDHGMRVGEPRSSRMGWYEDRLPFLFISLPDWYNTINDLHYFNLLDNADRLTSPYDIYMTLSHVLHGDNPKAPAGCETCHSLFSQVPFNRSCAEAGISDHWCACHDTTELSVSDPFAIYCGDLVVRAINIKLENDHDLSMFFRCATLKLRRILYFRSKVVSAVEEYVIGVQTYPGEAQFEATVTGSGTFNTVDDSISRINFYGSENFCAENPTLKLFCVCERVVLPNVGV